MKTKRPTSSVLAFVKHCDECGRKLRDKFVVRKHLNALRPLKFCNNEHRDLYFSRMHPDSGEWDI